MNQVSVNNAVTTDPEFKTWMKGVLHDEHVKDLCVVFTKKDGTEREMQCTLVESRIPQDKQPKSEASDSTTAGQGNDDAVRVFDTQIGEWRSFRWDSIKSVNFSL
jgi:hypothetical protein